MTTDWKKWKHVTKLDPDKLLTPGDVAAIVDSGTDALMVSGTQNITADNVARLVDMLREYRIPKVLESRLFYGGGINSRERAAEMARYADTIVVGNLVYERGGIDKLKETVI